MSAKCLMKLLSFLIITAFVFFWMYRVHSFILPVVGNEVLCSHVYIYIYIYIYIQIGVCICEFFEVA